MSTIIDCGNGRFIAGDPVEQLGVGEHWCTECSGSGLSYDWDCELEVCSTCDGSGAVTCSGGDCAQCVDLRWDRLKALLALCRNACDRAIERRDYDEYRRLDHRWDTVADARRALCVR